MFSSATELRLAAPTQSRVDEKTLDEAALTTITSQRESCIPDRGLAARSGPCFEDWFQRGPFAFGSWILSALMAAFCK
jgi:hypothetical protein